jgi:hypothetical protein
VARLLDKLCELRDSDEVGDLPTKTPLDMNLPEKLNIPMLYPNIRLFSETLGGNVSVCLRYLHASITPEKWWGFPV